MKKLFIGLAIVSTIFMTGACTKSNSARKALEQQGYTNISLGGYGWFGCSQGDYYATKFNAKSPTGQAVDGVVCEGLLKGITIRTY